MSEIPQEEGREAGYYTLSVLALPSRSARLTTQVKQTTFQVVAILVWALLTIIFLRSLFFDNPTGTAHGCDTNWKPVQSATMRPGLRGTIGSGSLPQTPPCSMTGLIFPASWSWDFICVWSGFTIVLVVLAFLIGWEGAQVVNLRFSHQELESCAATSLINDKSQTTSKVREGNVCHSLQRALREEGLKNGELYMSVLTLLQPALHKEFLTLRLTLELFFSGQLGMYDHAPIWHPLAASAPGGRGPDSGGSSTPGAQESSSSSSAVAPAQRDTTQQREIALGTYTNSASSSGRSDLTASSSASHEQRCENSTAFQKYEAEHEDSSPGTLLPGWDFDGNKPAEREDAKDNLVMKVAGGLMAMVFYVSSFGNFLAAIRERFVKKRRAPKLTVADKERIKGAVKALCDQGHGIFSRGAIKRSLQDLGLFPHMKSKKWSVERFQRAWEDLLSTDNPRYRLSGAVKTEPIKPGKPPRPLIADGDSGQLMALVTIKVLEECMFHHNHNHCIKHRSKDEAMADIVRGLQLPSRGQTVVETDGSAWDACCNDEIRELIENTIMDHIDREITKFGWWNPKSWQDIHAVVNGDKNMKLKVCKDLPGSDKRRMTVKAFRRSGHRGTSCLNYLINMVLTDLSYLDHPYHNNAGRPGGIMHITKGVMSHRAKDRWGTWRTYYRAFEGDDGIAALSGSLSEQQLVDVTSFWERCGFNMKLNVRTKLAEFVGWKIPLAQGVPTGQACPDILRMVNQSQYTTSKEAIDEYKANGKSRIIAAKFQSYAYAARKLPSFATYFKQCSEWYGGASFEDWTPDLQRAYEHDFRIADKCIAESHDYLHSDIVERVSKWEPDPATPETPQEEFELMLSLGLVSGHADYLQVTNALRVMDPTWTNRMWRGIGLGQYAE